MLLAATATDIGRRLFAVRRDELLGEGRVLVAVWPVVFEKRARSLPRSSRGASRTTTWLRRRTQSSAG
jgi:hypothetical protein